MNDLKNFIKDLITDDKGKPDEGVLMIIGLVSTMIGNSLWATIHNHQPFNPQEFGIGCGTLIGAAYAGLNAFKASVSKQP